MKAINRDTRLKLSYNPTGELVKILTRIIKIKIARKLRAFCAAAVAVITLSCSTDLILPLACPDGCQAQMVFPVSADENGYYHIRLDWSREYYPYFAVDVKASKVDEQYEYGGVKVVTAEFDSNASWIIGDSLTFIEPIYNPFLGNYTSSGVPIPISTSEVVLSQFSGMRVNVVQSSPIYFSEDEQFMYSRRIVGSIPPTMIGDTITLYMEVFWDAGMQSVKKSNFSEKFIVE